MYMLSSDTGEDLFPTSPAFTISSAPLGGPPTGADVGNLDVQPRPFLS